MPTVTLKVPNISCHHCVNAIKRELQPIAGVVSVEATVDTKLVTVTFEPENVLSQIKAALEEIGYPVEE